MNALKIYKKLSGLPMGNHLFTKMVCKKAPYFGSIKPLIIHFDVGVCRATIKKRRSIENHIGTVHAIAMCNAAELCGGLAIDSCMPKDLRWIPKAMTVKYLKKATTDLVSECVVDASQIEVGDNIMDVKLTDTAGETVFTAQIAMYVSKK